MNVFSLILNVMTPIQFQSNFRYFFLSKYFCLNIVLIKFAGSSSKYKAQKRIRRYTAACKKTVNGSIQIKIQNFVSDSLFLG